MERTSYKRCSGEGMSTFFIVAEHMYVEGVRYGLFEEYFYTEETSCCQGLGLTPGLVER